MFILARLFIRLAARRHVRPNFVWCVVALCVTMLGGDGYPVLMVPETV